MITQLVRWLDDVLDVVLAIILFAVLLPYVAIRKALDRKDGE